MRLPSPPLLIVTDRSQARAPLADVLRAAFAAGARWASVREKDLWDAEQVALAQSLLPVGREFGATLTLHGSPVLAKQAGLDGVHLSAGGDIAAARRIMGKDALIGISIHTLAEALATEGADYAIAGPAFPTQSKPGYGPFLETQGIAAMAKATKTPIVPIGGIETENAPDVLDAGALGFAVMGGVMRAADPGLEVKRLLAALTSPSGTR
ncbi:thiamine-phosphate synthase [Variibacter gotjawalensis]|uniref:Thiamine-phosphate synthase n=1 Tax=Variibacter gotjawalensis TaxID=1333996 RepID=A0A0S3PX04_9BRAD|nr:thiamine phosphate synthase [Variibacter gotjawalensis]NIK46146.1 thiamine-phosphate pyrophosphorylase [Variibacter gotjawalensis]RZS48064.1 thiamine-phosphate pyrophosphorylase [Variibacter gotjawalensis]BAT60320.1 thiamine-phosphate synthase [Variibacter gotjawalensis]